MSSVSLPAPHRESAAASSSNRVWRRLAGVLALAASPLALAGCGSSDEPTVPVFPVTGKVELESSEIPVGAKIILHPQGHTIPPDVVVSAAVQDDGTFQVGTFRNGDGAPAGDYIATVQWQKIVPTADGGAAGPNVLPKKYAKPDTSPIRISVKDELGNKVSPIRISRR